MTTKYRVRGTRPPEEYQPGGLIVPAIRCTAITGNSSATGIERCKNPAQVKPIGEFLFCPEHYADRIQTFTPDGKRRGRDA